MTTTTTATRASQHSPSRWRHALRMGVQAFAASFAATASVGTAIASILTGSLLVAEIVLFGCLLLSAILAALTTFGAYRIHLEDERRATGECPRCGYDLRESMSRCPECGVRFMRRVKKMATAESLPRRQTWA